MLGGAYSKQYQNIERQHVDTIKTFAENEKHDSLARARKLSIETNKRRRALAIKRKSEAEKEEKRRQHILAKRRERQNEATERFQRGHISSSRPSSGASSASRWSPRHATSSRLDEALKLVRGSPTNSRQSSARGQGRTSPNNYYRQNTDPLSKPYFNKYAHPSINQTLNGYEKKDDLHSKSLRNLNNSRTLFEQQLQSHQQSLLSQQQKALQDFNKQIMKEIEVDKNVINGESIGNGMERSESLSNADSLEDNESNDTLRESCDIDRYMNLQNGNGNGSRNDRNANNESRHEYQSANGQLNNNIILAHGMVNNTGNLNQTIDSYNTQAQFYNNTATPTSGQQQQGETKQQQYYQRQLEIQQQLQEQQQQKQKEEMERKVWEQQEKQRQLIQQQHQRQQQELQEKQRQQELEKQRQQELAERLKHQEMIEKQKMQQQELQEKQRQQELEKQRQQELAEKQRRQQEALERQRAERLKHQEMIEKQKLQEEHIQRLRMEAEQQQRQQARQQSNVTQQHGQVNMQTNSYGNTDSESQRPKVQVKAWATPSPHPPTPASAVSNAQLVTNASPYTGKATHTNVTTTTMVYDKNATSTNNGYQKPGAPVSYTGTTSGIDTNVTNTQTNKPAGKSVAFKTEPSSQEQQPNLSFLESVTRDLTGTTNQDSSSGPSGPASTLSCKSINSAESKNSVSSPKTTVTNTDLSKPQISPAVGKPSAYYKGSYGAQFAANKGPGQQGSSGNSGRHNGNGLPQSVGFMVDHQLEMIPGPGLNNDDTADTDSVSTICDEKEPEPKEIKSILKRSGSAGSQKKAGGILKKSGSTGNMEIRDSLEITRVHLQTPAEEKEQKVMRELERAQNLPPPPTKKNVRFADMCYDGDSEDSRRDGEDDKLFVKRKEDSDAVTHKPPRPVSAVALKTNSIQMNSKPPRASSASTLRTSTIPRAKTQVVRPQATAHIITQNNHGGGSSEIEAKKKVTIVNNDFMQKVPAMARNNQTLHTVTPAAVFSATSATQPRPQDQKVNYAVSSIIMPKSASAPFIYPGYPKQGPGAPTGCVDGPSEAGNNSKYDGAMFDENGLRIDRTPTDDEINFLWDKLKSCLNRNTSTTDKSQVEGHRQAAPVSNTYIDGNALGQYNSLNRVAQPPTYNGLRRQNSLDSAGNTYAKRYGLLQQRRQQPNPNSLKSRQAGAQQQHAPVPSHTDPQQIAGVQPGQDVSESMAGFLVAENLADQSLSDSAIHQAIDDAQTRQQAYNSGRPQAKAMTALSLEEQHVLESLDRLNDKLKVSDVPIPNGNAALAPVPREQTTPTHHQPPQQQQQHQQHKQIVHMGGFRGHTPISQRRVIESATHKARLRITSAVHKRNVHRTQ